MQDMVMGFCMPCWEGSADASKIALLQPSRVGERICIGTLSHHVWQALQSSRSFCCPELDLLELGAIVVKP